MTELLDRLTKVIDTASRAARECTWLFRRLEEVPDSSSLRKTLPSLIEKVLDICGISFSLRLKADNLETYPCGDPARDRWSSNYYYLDICADTLDEICEAAVAVSNATSSSDHHGNVKGHDKGNGTGGGSGSLTVITNDNSRLTPALILNFQLRLGRLLGRLSSGRSCMDMYSLHRSVSANKPVPEPPPNGTLSPRKLKPSSNSHPDSLRESLASSSLDSLKGHLAQLDHPSQDRPILLSYYEEERAVEARNNINPAYPIAATAWISPLINTEWKSLREPVLALLDLGPKRHGRSNFIHCLSEYCRQTWPKRYATGPHAGRALDALRDLDTRKLSLPLSFAAAMGLSEVIQEIISTRSFEFDWAVPLYSALLGPSTLLSTSSRTTWERINEPPYSVAQAKTLRLILQTGHGFTRAWLWHHDIQPSPPDYLAFLVCLRLRDAELFMTLYPLCGPISDQFKQLVRPGPFWEPATSAYEACASLESREYLNDVLVRLTDHVYPLADSDTMSYSVFEGVLKLAQRLDLPCTRADHEWREESIHDSDFLTKVHGHIRGGEAVAIRRLIQDPRWDPNLPYDSEQWHHEESDGGTILHMAVEAGNGDTVILETLLKSGADVSRTDNRGRTPLMLCENAGSYRLLVQHGASTLHQDVDGRTCWHFAAANGDLPALAWLAQEDPHMAENLRVATKEGCTPLAEAVLSVARLENRDPTTYYGLEASVFLCDLAGGDAECVKSPIPLLHSAVQWGDEGLIHTLLSLGVDPNQVSANGTSPLHHLTPSATAGLVRLLLKVCTKVPLFRPSSQATPPENLLGNLDPVGARIRADDQSATTGHTLNVEGFTALLTPEILESKDFHGRGLWERYCRKNLASLGDRRLSPRIIVSAAEHLVEAKALQRYEEETGESGITLFYQCSTANPSPRALHVLFPMYSILLRKTLHLKEFIKSPEALDLAALLVTLNSTELLDELLGSGVSVHDRPLEGRERKTLLELACAPAGAPGIIGVIAGDRCTKQTFETLLKYADKERLDDLDANSQGLIHMLINPSVMHRDEKLTMLLDKGASPNLMRWGKSPALVSYVLDRQTDAALLLLGKGADPGLATKDGMDASLAAASRGSVRILDKLKAVVPEDFNWARTCRSHFTIVHPGGAQITTTASNCNALHLAAFNGYGLVIQFYLTHFDLDVNYAIQDDLRRPVHFAAVSGSSSCIRVLHEHGADLDARTRDGSSALHTAVRGSQAQAVKTLLELGPANPVDNELMTPFMHALRIGFAEITRLFVDVERFRPAFYPSVLRARYVGQAIEAAVRAGDVTQCRNLLSVTALADFETSPLKCGGCTPVFLAVREARADVLVWLLGIGATGFAGSCPLHSREGGFSALNSLCRNPQLNGCLEAMLDAYLREGIDWTCAATSPLHAAARENNHRAIVIIADHVTKKSQLYRQRFRFSGLEKRDKKARISLGDATSMPRHTRRGPVPRGEPSSLHPHNKRGPASITLNRRGTASSGELSFTSIPRHVLDQGVRPERSGRDTATTGWTALHFAASWCHEEVMRVLLSLGADANAEDAEHNTPLHIAVRNGFDAGVEMLLAAGAHPDRAHGQGFTPLMASIEAGNMAIGRMLVAKGANIRAVDPDGMALLNIAGERTKNPAVVRYLLDLGLSPYRRDKAGYMPVDDMILNYDMLGYVLNGEFDLTRVRDLNKGFFSLVIELNRNHAVAILKRLLKRLPPEITRGLVNSTPARFVSALCSAVYRDCFDAIDVLVRYGADVNVEGCVEGTALMAACARGRLDSVKLLVERGAWLAYKATTTTTPTREPGEEREVIKNALDFARKFPEIQRWLLVERYTERKTLLSAAHDADGDEPEVRAWSGPWTACYRLQGSAGEHFREPRESRLDFLERMATVREGLAGRVLGAVELVRASGEAVLDLPEVSVWDLERESWSAMAMLQVARPGWFRDRDNPGPALARAIHEQV